MDIIFPFAHELAKKCEKCNCATTPHNVQCNGFCGRKGAGTSLTYVLCTGGHISVRFSASSMAGRFPDYLPFVSILFCAALQIASGQLWGGGARTCQREAKD
ncbi:hypothetical protein NPIL_350931 [Nephila pilipes]|uniref:Uncharacterized protein n=1 Tax=Nephila pilipes TaxID=299642 RepID=A0A8X6IWL5_NEPPI|nr:hypothetical protein NPIL_350931 [Nephila pilipes]